MTPEQLEPVLDVHLKGAFYVTQPAFVHMKEQGYGRIVNTSSGAGIFGNFGQTNYGAAKMGIAGFTIIAALELHRYGITVNAISPGALTRLTEGLRPEPPSEAEIEAQSPRWIAPICTWLASPLSKNVTGRVFQVHGQEIAIAESWHKGPAAANVDDPEQMTDVVARLMAEARPNADMAGNDAVGPGRPGPTI